MAKNKLKNEFVVRTSPGSEWYYALNARSLKKLERQEGSQHVEQMPSILAQAKTLAACDHFNMMCQTIDNSPSMKKDLATVMADLILKDPKRITNIIALTEAEETDQRKEFLNATYKHDIEDQFGHEMWDLDYTKEFWTLAMLRAAPPEQYTRPLSSLPDESVQQYIQKLNTATDAAHQALSIVLTNESTVVKQSALIQTLSNVGGYRSLLDMAGCIGIHFGDRTYEQGDMWDGAFEEDIITTFDAVAAAMRNIAEISAPQVAKERAPYTAISVRDSKEGGLKVVHESIVERYRKEHGLNAHPALDAPS